MTVHRKPTTPNPRSDGHAAQESGRSRTALGIVAVLFLAFLTAGLGDRRPWAASPASGPIRPQTTINPNTAAWYELAQLPGIGESIARRIVEFRERRALESAGPVFTGPADLDAVRGIGPKKIQRIGRYLRYSEITSGNGAE